LSKAVKKTFDIAAFLANLRPGKTELKFTNGKNIYKQGDPADAVFYIVDGKVKLTVVSKEGKEAVVAILNEGQFFGESCLSGQLKRIGTTKAIGSCQIIAIKRKAMLAALQTEQPFAEFFTTYLLTRNVRIEEDLIDQLFNSSEARLMRLLLLLANFGKDGTDAQPIDLKISQETLAEMIGTTRSRVSFFMNKFRKLGFIKYNGRIEVHNSLLHAVLHEKPKLKQDD
jgi:CRP/FNR family transcriptional regulator, cyclic AMP receptor protein